MKNQNTNADPEENSVISAMSSITSVARDATTSHVDGNGDRASVSRQAGRSAMTYFLLLIRDFLTFFVRGGLSTTMLVMDQTLRLGLLGAEALLGHSGANVLGYPCRAAMWVYQILLWVAYTILELLLYLPWPILLMYVIVLIIFYFWMPPPFTNIFKQLFVMLHRFIGFYKGVFGLIKG